MIYRVIIVFFLLAVTNVLFADVDSLGIGYREELLSLNDSPTFGFMMMQMLGMLLLISVTLYLALYFAKKINAKYKNKNEAYSFKVHENVYISTKQGLSAISFGKKLYIVGFSQNSINLIDTIEDDEIISQLTLTKTQSKRFSDMLKGYFVKTQ
jgi:flagellar biogenesis protein FliO